MKCTFVKVHVVETENYQTEAFIEGFIPLNANLLPESTYDWIINYPGVEADLQSDGVKIKVHSTTKCAPSDVYDRILGAHIAESKAKTKLYRFIRNLTMEVSDYFIGLAEYYSDAWDKYEHCLTHELEHTEYLKEQ